MPAWKQRPLSWQSKQNKANISGQVSEEQSQSQIPNNDVLKEHDMGPVFEPQTQQNDMMRGENTAATKIARTPLGVTTHKHVGAN